LEKNELFDLTIFPKNIIIPPNERKNIIVKEEVDDIDIKNLEILNEILNNNNNEKLFTKSKEMNLLEDIFNEKMYNIINYELDHIKKHLENIKLNRLEKIEYVRNYFENGLLIPIIFYFKKIFTFVHFFTGEEMIKIFSLIKKTIKLKLFISKFKIDFWHCNQKDKSNYLEDNLNISFDENNASINSINYYYTINKNASIIDGKYFINNKFIELTYESLNYINSNKISVFDYTSLYQIIDKELFSLIKERKVLNIARNFKIKYNKSLKEKNMKINF
jgi:hypothetical protein